MGTEKRFFGNVTTAFDRKKTGMTNTNIEPKTITDLSSVQTSFKTILTKHENFDKLIISFNGLQESMTFVLIKSMFSL